MTPPDTLAALRATARPEVDLTRAADQEHLVTLADRVLAADLDPAPLAASATDPSAPLQWRIVHKLVESRRWLLGEQVRPIHVAVVFAMWGEQHRLRPHGPDNPHGEDALRVKIEQLQWATAGTPVTWTMYAVDDGCPYGSGALAAEIAAATPGGDQVRVLHLAEHVPTDSGPLRHLASADDSRKGGSIILGAERAIADGADVVVYTDADASVHLGQLGLLLRPHVEDQVPVVLGDRRHPDSVLVKDAARWGVGIKNLRHMQRMVGAEIFSLGILDTQAAFKLYEATLLTELIADPVSFDFSFDTDWIAGFVARQQRFAQVPFAFIDSAAESATAKQEPMTTWEVLLTGLVAQLRHHDLLRTPAARAMAAVIDEEITDHRVLDAIIDDLPPELAAATEADYGDPGVMTPEAMRAYIIGRRQAFLAEQTLP
ncbi:MAG TPA: glycosyltransferase [Intrasporangiaceae bacterium]|nr:glycosyltransferase [Intrasporangiaceae bacterium]